MDDCDWMNLLLGKRNDDEDAKEKLYTYATHVVVPSFKVGAYFLSIQMYPPCSPYIDRSSISQGLEHTVVDAE